MGAAAAVLGGTGLGSIISGTVTGAAGIGSTIASNQANKDIAQMNNVFNEKMLDKQINYNKEMYQQQLGDTWQFYNDSKQNQWDMWNATNKYNSASAQRQRLEAAGLNPQLLMSGNNVGTATATGGTSASSPSAQGINPPTATPYSADYSGIAQGIGNAIDAYVQLQNSKSQRDVMREQALGQGIDNKTKYAEAIARITKMFAETKDAESRALLNDVIRDMRRDLDQSAIDKNNAEVVKLKQEATGVILDNMYKFQTLAVLPQMLQLDIAQKTADIQLRIAQGQLTVKQVEHEIEKLAETVARTEYVRSQKSGQDISNRFDSETFDLRKRQLRESIKSIISSQKLPDSWSQFFGFGHKRDYSGL